jgi:DNA-binding CsgD family transcriptional regulator
MYVHDCASAIQLGERTSRLPRPALTAREREVVRCVAFGMRNDEVAHRLSISPSTVRTHLARVFRKLQVRSRRELAGHALRLGIV